tara:strand:+ start:218 stop:688 length:471 start_codon:yes stop_codon:yes gene_type:complete
MLSFQELIASVLCSAIPEIRKRLGAPKVIQNPRAVAIRRSCPGRNSNKRPKRTMRPRPVIPIKTCKDLALKVPKEAECKYLFSNIQPMQKLESIITATAALGVGAPKKHGVIVVTTIRICFENDNLAMRDSKNLNKYEYVATKAIPASIPRTTSVG